MDRFREYTRFEETMMNLYEAAAEELYFEFDRDPTDEEVEERVKVYLDQIEPDYDALLEDYHTMKEEGGL